MYRSILVPLDISRRAERIRAHIEDMARLFESKLIFLTVLRSYELTE